MVQKKDDSEESSFLYWWVEPTTSLRLVSFSISDALPAEAWAPCLPRP